MEQDPPLKKPDSKTEIYIDNIFINAMMSSIRNGTDSLELYDNVAEELLRQLDAREPAERARFLGKAMMTLIHTTLRRRRLSDPLTG